MGYLHIENLYKNQDILMFRECYAMEKIHGSSAHVAWTDGVLSLFGGGVKAASFAGIFDQPALTDAFTALGHSKVTVYGEVYGGNCQGMKATYGDVLRFVAFDVSVDRGFVSVPDAEDIATKLGLPFVHYVRVSTDLAALDAERDAPSEQAFRNGCANREDPATWKKREGVVLRPLVEMCRPYRDSGRIIAKHKAAEFCERATQPAVDAEKQAALAAADAIALEWVTDMRLAHVLDKLGNPKEMAKTGAVIAAMVEDVLREAKDEIVDSAEARKAISTRTVKLYKAIVTKIEGPSGL